MRKLAWPAFAVLIVLGFQVATVTANYGGNWTGLFCTGSQRDIPPALAPEHIHVFEGSAGYDGQVYHYIAHDPFFRKGFKKYVDDPRIRYRRILLPGLAWILAAGQTDWIDFTYISLWLAFAGLGTYWLSEYAERSGRPRWYGLFFLLLPAAIVSSDRMVTDGVLAAFCMGFLLYTRENARWKLWAVIAAAALTRETGVLLAGGMILYELISRRWKSGAFFATALAPALAWFAFVQAETRQAPYGGVFVPFYSIVYSLFNPFAYPPRVRFIFAVQTLDRLALVGMLLAMVLAGLQLRRRSPVALAAALFALTAVVMQRPDNWVQAYDFGRIYTPLLAFLAVDWLGNRRFLPLAPLLMILPRVGLQFVPQIEGILHMPH